jgi:hypothetical protein
MFVAHVITVGAPANSEAPVLGPVTTNEGVAIVNAPLVPDADPGPVIVTRASAVAAGNSVTVQVKLPVLGALDATVWNVPPSREISMRAVALAGRFVVQVIAVDVPESNVVPATGAVTTTVGVMIANVPPVATVVPGLVTVTRTSAAPVSGPVTVHAKLPVFGALDVSV